MTHSARWLTTRAAASRGPYFVVVVGGQSTPALRNLLSRASAGGAVVVAAPNPSDEDGTWSQNCAVTIDSAPPRPA